MGEKYFVFSFNDDGDMHVSCLTKDELESRLAEDYWGEDPPFLDADSNFEVVRGLLIIKGERIEPKPVETVKRWAV